MNVRITLAIIGSFFFISFPALGQKIEKGWEAGVWLGGAHYFGDLNTTLVLRDPGLAAGVRGRYILNERLAYSLGLSYGRISADDADSDISSERQRNLSFRSNVYDISGMLEFNFFPFKHGSYDKIFTPYMGLGLSFFGFNPQAELDGEWYDLIDYATEGDGSTDRYSRFSGSLLLALGIKYNLNYRWSINAEITTQRVFTDYLDDVSTVYPDLNSLDPLSRQLSDRTLPSPDVPLANLEGQQRGNERDNDSFSFLKLGVNYFFGSIRCPDISRYGYELR